MNKNNSQDLEQIRQANQKSAQNAKNTTGSMNSSDLQQAIQANQQSRNAANQNYTASFSNSTMDPQLERIRKENQESAKKAQQGNMNKGSY